MAHDQTTNDPDRGRGPDEHDPLASLRRAVTSSPIATVVTAGRDHRIVYGNARFEKDVGPPGQPLEQQPLTALFEERDELQRVLDGVLAEGRTERVTTHALRGTPARVVQLLVQPIDADGVSRGLLVQVTASQPTSRAEGSGTFELPVSELAEANERLIIAGLREQAQALEAQAHANELTALLHSMSEGVTVFSARTDIVMVNPAARAMFGFREAISADEFRRLDLRRADGTPIDFARDLLTPMLEGKQLAEHEVTLWQGDNVHHLMLSNGLVHDEHGKVRLIIMVARDITQLRDLERQRERYVALISHDLRGPLSAARMAASIVGMVAEQSPQIIELADTIDRQLGRMDQMIRDLLDAQRIRAGELVRLRLVECDLVEIARGVISELSTIHRTPLELEGDASVRGVWGAEEVRRALWNLATNAIKYGEPAKPVVIRIQRVGDRAVISVRNEGKPIAPEDQARLFAPYSRAANAMAGGARGWGLGLTLVRGCADAHGGTVSVLSDDHGTTFTMELPFAKGHAPAADG